MLVDMTRSEIHAVMTGGFATIAGSVLAAYIIFGVRSFLLSSIFSFFFFFLYSGTPTEDFPRGQSLIFLSHFPLLLSLYLMSSFFTVAVSLSHNSTI